MEEQSIIETNGKRDTKGYLRGVEIKKARKGTMLEAIADTTMSSALADPSKVTVNFLIQALDDAYHAQGKASGVELLQCDGCGGLSPETLSACPFCGKAEGDAEQASTEVVSSKKHAVPSTDEDDEIDALEDEEPAAPKAKSKRTKKVNPAQATLPIATLAKKSDAIIIDPKTVAIEKAGNYTERDLNAAVARVVKLKGDTCVSMWHLGVEFTNIHTKQLWKLRTDDVKGARYKAFDQFCARELGMSHGNVFSLIDVSRNFSEAQARAFGTSKLALLLEAPEVAQAKIMEEKIAKGAPLSEVREEVKKARAEHGVVKRNTGRRKAPKGKTTNTSKNPEKITIAGLLGKHKVSLVTKATAKDEEPKAAKRLADEPVGTLEMSNRTKMHFSIITDKAGGLVLQVVTTRDEA